jgi:UDP-3-O-[3-hydroxymyristoyl] glucosamine N-acyltransferase
MRALESPVRLGELVEALGGSLFEAKDADISVLRIAPLESALNTDIGFVSQARYLPIALTSKAAALIVNQSISESLKGRAGQWIVENPYSTYAKLSGWFANALALKPTPGIHPTAVIDPTAKVAATATIDAGVFIGARAVIGEAAHLYPNVVVYHDCEIGCRTIVHSGTVIGSDGFGFAREAGQWIKIEQLGCVTIGDDVEIGSNCSIDRGALENTEIANGVKIDNLVQIAHNVRIGEGTAIAGCVGIAGSAVIGKNCSFGGSAGILGHLEICDNVVVSSMSLVTRSIKKAGFYSGVFPLQDNADWERVAASLKQLPMLRQRLRELERGAVSVPNETSGSEISPT